MFTLCRVINVHLSFQSKKFQGEMEKRHWILETFISLSVCDYFVIFHYPSRTGFIMCVTPLSELI